MAKEPIGTTASTGQKCPQSGIWEVVDTPAVSTSISKGHTMPSYEGLAARWKLIQYA